MTIKEMAKSEPGIREMLNADGSIKQGYEDKVYEAMADMASRSFPTAFKRGEFKSRPEYNAIFDIINPSDPASRAESNKFFKDLYKNNSIPGAVVASQESGGGIFSTAWNFSAANPVAKAITAAKMGNAESDKMWEQFQKENVSPFQMNAWIDQYLKDHGFKTLTQEDKAKITTSTKGKPGKKGGI
jgi:hypothetical protein